MNDEPRMRRLFRLPSSARRVERDIDDELAFHLDTRVDDLVAGGMGAAAAREQALREFGDVGAARREIGELDRRRLRRGRVAEWWEGVRQDLRYGSRSLRRQPSFLATAMITLGLGIGATTAIFSAVNGVLLRPLPYPRPDRIVVLRERNEKGGEMNASGPNVLDWRTLGRGLVAAVAAYVAEPTTVLGGAEPVRVGAAAVSEDFFRVMGTRPAIGRGFVAEETGEGGPAAVVVSDRFWREQLASDPRVEARSLEVNGRSARVVGVMPEGFAFPAATDVWVPLDLAHTGEDRTAHNWQVVARLRDGVEPAAARAGLDLVQRRVKAQYGEKADAVGVTVTTLHDDLVGPARRSLLLLFGAAGLVLLVACTNVASTLLARGSVRRREIEVRSALGASRARVVRQLFTESVLLALLGAAVGLVTAAVALRALVSLAPPGALPRLADIQVDGWAVAFAIAMAALAAVLSGLLPAVRLAESGSGRTLLLRGAATGGGGSGWSALVAGEVALAVLLLVGAGLLARSFGQLLRVDPGFRATNAIAVHLSLPESKYPTDTAVGALYAELLPELRAIPGVASVGLVNRLPLSGSGLNGAFEVDGRGPQSGWSDYRVASAGYFRAMGIPLRRGRLFDDAVDRAGAPDVVVVSQALADKYWPGEDPVGKRIRDHANDSFHYGRDRWLTVVGVVGDVRDGLTAKIAPTVYVSYAQRPFRARDAVVAVSGAVPPSALVAAVRGRLRDRYASIPAELRTMDAQMAGVLDGRRFTMTMLGAFAALALVLAAVGIYGVVSYRVAQRTQEIGIRIALGATAGQVRWVVIADAMGVVVAGLIAGAAGAVALTRLLSSLLYDTSPTDAPTFAGVLLLLLAAGWLASWLPARRATRVDPLVALRAG